MNIKNPILGVSIRYGAVAAAVSILLFSILYFSGKNPLLIPPFLDFRLLLFPIFLFFGIRDFRENKNGGILHFWQGFAVGFLTVLFISIIMGLFIFFLGRYIDPDLTSNYIHTTLDNIIHSKERIIAQVGELNYNKTLALLPTTSLADLSLDYFLKSLPPGIILTILISLVLRINQK